MSVPGTPLRGSTTAVHVTGVCVSSAPGKKAKTLTSGSLRIGSEKYELIRDEDGSLRRQFQNIVGLSPETRISLGYKTSSFSLRTTQKIDTSRLLTGSADNQIQDLSVVHGDIQVIFNCQATGVITGMSSPTTQASRNSAEANTKTLQPTTEAILDDCPKFRILVIGKTGVGKSTLINMAFGFNKAASADLQRGKADIQIGLESPANERFILHDSLGFEPGDKDNYETVKQFIEERKRGKDPLHAVWFCIRAPKAGERVLEVAAEDFFRTKKQTMGAIPLIVVFTKFDRLVDEQVMQLAEPNADEKGATARASSEAESIVQAELNKIIQLAGEPLSHAVASTKECYIHTLQKLIELTHRRVETSSMPKAQVTSVVTLMAQRIDPHLSIQGSISVGRQRYWKALCSSPYFAGRTIWDCLSVIHADIVTVWNFNDPACHLLDKKFKELVTGMVQEMEMPQINPNGILALGGGSSLIAAVSDFLGSITDPSAPIVLPAVARLVAPRWLSDIYENQKNMQQIFMAFIVDLTHVMETLAILTRDHNKLTRRAIKIAYQTYRDSSVRSQAHVCIQGYRDLGGQDAALGVIESLIKPKSNGDSNLGDYYAKVSKLDLQRLNLGTEEDW